MDETKIFNTLYELKEDVDAIKTHLENIPTRTDMNEKLDTIIHIVERLDHERMATNYRLDTHENRITTLEQHISSI